MSDILAVLEQAGALSKMSAAVMTLCSTWHSKKPTVERPVLRRVRSDFGWAATLLVAAHPLASYFFLRGVWARSDAIGPRSLFGVFGLRKSLPA